MDHEGREHNDAEADEGKRPWTKPVVRSIDQVAATEGQDLFAPDEVNEGFSVYFCTLT